MKNWFTLVFCVSLSTLFGSSPEHLFKKYKNPIFVETGTYIGQGTRQAIRAGYDEIHTIEIYRPIFDEQQSAWAKYPQVHSYFGDSAESLWCMIESIDRPITFWLDGHYSGPGTGQGYGYTPILEELDQIARHPIKTHTILIDDMRCCSKPEFNFITREQIEETVKKINPDYEISYEDGEHNGTVFVKDILVARIR